MMCLMWSVYLIPVEKIRENIRASADIMAVMPEHVHYAVKIPGMFFDTWTDSRMLNAAGFPGYKGPFEDSLFNYRAHYFGPPYLSLSVVAKGGMIMGAWAVDYARFWQGYLIFLKPLLVFFDLVGIRYINLVFQLGLLVAILCLMYKRLGFKHCVAFVTAMCFFNPLMSWKCLEFAIAVNVMLVAVLWVLLSKSSDDRWIFFVIGTVEILFDWLTYPLVTLGIPLILYICLYERGFKDDVKCVIKNSLLWLFGYAGMWFMKWVLVSVFTEKNMIKESFKHILRRSYGLYSGGEPFYAEISYLKAINYNVKEILCEGSLYYIFFFCLVVSCFSWFSRFIKSEKVAVLLGIGLMPFIWHGGVVQHSVHHPWMAHKILTITIYAILASVVCCLEPKKS